MRLDQKMHELGLVRSRSQAQDLIKNKKVLVNGVLQVKSSFAIKEGDQIQIQDSELIEFVSRAGVKLKGALEFLNLSVEGFKFLDIGLSTGGFSDCLLRRGASSGVGIDVGHSQLHSSLQSKKELLSFDGVNAKNLSAYEDLTAYLQNIDLVVMDVSFISIKKILPEITKIKSENTKILSLVKPQFELDKSRLNKQGIVKETQDYILVEEEIRACFKDNAWKVQAYFESKLLGGDGNKEYFIYATQ